MKVTRELVATWDGTAFDEYDSLHIDADELASYIALARAAIEWAEAMDALARIEGRVEWQYFKRVNRANDALAALVEVGDEERG